MTIGAIVTGGFAAGGGVGGLITGGFLSDAPLPDNPARTLRPVVDGYAGRDFNPMSITNTENLTFDLSLILGQATIAAIVATILEGADSASVAADGSPMGRLVAGPSIDSTATKATLKIGNFLNAAAVINYRVGVVVRDSQGNVWDSWSVLPAAPRGDPVWGAAQ